MHELRDRGVQLPAKNDSYARSASHFLEAHLPAYRDTRWHLAYAASNELRDSRYIPEDAFYAFIEPRLNPLALADAYRDKNAYDLMPMREYTPEVIARCMSGNWFAGDYEPTTFEAVLTEVRAISSEIVAKPSLDSNGARGVVILPGVDVDGDGRQLHLLNRHGQPDSDIVVQHAVVQSNALAKLNSSSLNTVRIMTVRVQSTVEIASCMLRIGRKNSRVDNPRASGGVFVGIGPAGQLKKYGFFTNFARTDRHPDSGIVFDGYEVPGFNDACQLCSSLHHYLPHFDLVSWDVAIQDSQESKIIEFNLVEQDINYLQLTNGPLFGGLTGEVISKTNG